MQDQNSLAHIRYSHELLAWEYDQRNAVLAPGELEWYLKYAAQGAGPILELACGSGRLLLPIAAAGYEIHGVDNAAAMLARLDQKLQVYDDATRRRVRAFCSAMVTFTMPHRYGLAFIGYNSLRYLQYKDQLPKVFAQVNACLQPKGYLLFMLARVDLAQYTDGQSVLIDWLDQPITDPTAGIAIGSKFVSQLETSGERIMTERLYRIERPNIPTEIVTAISYAPVVSVVEYLAMLEQAGFSAQVYSGYDERPDDQISTTHCFVARKQA